MSGDIAPWLQPQPPPQQVLSGPCPLPTWPSVVAHTGLTRSIPVALTACLRPPLPASVLGSEFRNGFPICPPRKASSKVTFIQ